MHEPPVSACNGLPLLDAHIKVPRLTFASVDVETVFVKSNEPGQLRFQIVEDWLYVHRCLGVVELLFHFESLSLVLAVEHEDSDIYLLLGNDNRAFFSFFVCSLRSLSRFISYA